MVSYIRQCGDLLHLASFFVLLTKMLRQRSAAGISLKSMFLFALVYSTRYIDLFLSFISVYNTVMKIIFLCVSWYVVFLIKYKNPWKATYDRDNDTFRIQYLIGACFILGLCFHRKPRLGFFVEVLWAFSQYLEAVAILPQIFLLQYTERYEALTSHYLFTLGLYRAFYLIHWFVRYLNYGKFNAVSVVAGLVQTILYVDFFHKYITQVIRKTKQKYDLGSSSAPKKQIG
ncbi:ER lumen protein retaining receptor [Angomonas deanei]|nr:ER lumen protein retaining receptor [Angomonas deanei]|eukprot:EPY37808.1 ER lumen protein retaining receptor [Angomonas deanei]